MYVKRLFEFIINNNTTTERLMHILEIETWYIKPQFIYTKRVLS